MLHAAVYAPCTCCNSHELDVLRRDRSKHADVGYWQYSFVASNTCNRCSGIIDRLFGTNKYYHLWYKFGIGFFGCIAGGSLRFVTGYDTSRFTNILLASSSLMMLFHRSTVDLVSIPLRVDDVSIIENAEHSASVDSKENVKRRPHSAFVSYLTSGKYDHEYVTALRSWFPTAVQAFADCAAFSSRERLPGGLPSTGTPVEVRDSDRGNNDLGDSTVLPATDLDENTYREGAGIGHEDRITGGPTVLADTQIAAHQISGDLVQSEAFASTAGNISAALDNRVQQLPFRPDDQLKKRIVRTVDSLLENVFTVDAIRRWRVSGIDPHESGCQTAFNDMISRKWSSARGDRAIDQAYLDLLREIGFDFQIKTNEVQSASGKLPRPRIILNCGDVNQVKMLLPIKCLEDILFDFFEDASIKHLPKHAAMGRASKRLRQSRECHTYEGDGSSWDTCCNPQIRDMIENRIVSRIIDVLGFDGEVPREWMLAALRDMKRSDIRGRANIKDFCMQNVKVVIEAIRKSGHRGTSCLNYLINLVCWLAVLCDKPQDMIGKTRNGRLYEKYISAYDLQEYFLRYIFEGDDSALTTTESLVTAGRAEHIVKSWLSLGFRMKINYITPETFNVPGIETKQFLTFTGFDFLCAKNGPTFTFFPEIKRSLANSAWTTSPEVRQHPGQLHRVAAASFLARAEHFVDFKPLCHYYLALANAHVAVIDDFVIGESEAVSLGIVPGAIRDRISEVSVLAKEPTQSSRKLYELVVGPYDLQKMIMLSNLEIVDPLDTARLKHLLPREMWHTESATVVRPRGDIARLLRDAVIN